MRFELIVHGRRHASVMGWSQNGQPLVTKSFEVRAPDVARRAQAGEFVIVRVPARGTYPPYVYVVLIAMTLLVPKCDPKHTLWHIHSARKSGIL
jgi:hypothetical protein